MKVLFADHSQPVITSAREYNPTFDIQLGNPLAFDIDAVVSPANTRGIMNGGFDAVLRSFFGTIIEYRVRARLRENPLDVGRACAVPTSHPKINKVIVTPTVSISGSGAFWPCQRFLCLWLQCNHVCTQCWCESARINWIWNWSWRVVGT